MFKTKYAILLVSCLLSTITFAQNNDSRITIVLRIDDYGLDNADFYPNLLTILRKHKIPLTIGVIPFRIGKSSTSILPMDSAKQVLLKRIISPGDVEIAIHGYTHHNNNKNQNYTDSEFVNLPLKKQTEMVKTAIAFFEKEIGVSVVSFIPPWNSFDRNTIKALKANNLKIISPSLFCTNDWTQAGISYVPSTIDINSLNTTLLSKLSKQASKRLIVVLFHETDFIENKTFQKNQNYNDANNNYKYNLSKLDSLLTETNKNKAVQFVTLKDIPLMFQAEQFNNLTYKHNLHKSVVLPIPEIIKPRSQGYYLSSNEINIFNILAILIPFVFYVSIMTATLLVLYLLNKSLLLRFLFKIFPIPLLFIVVYSVSDLSLGLKGTISLHVLISWVIFWLILIKKTKQTTKNLK